MKIFDFIKFDSIKFDSIKKEFNNIKENGDLPGLILISTFLIFCVSLIVITIIYPPETQTNLIPSLPPSIEIDYFTDGHICYSLMKQNGSYISHITISCKDVKYLTKKTLIDE